MIENSCLPCRFLMADLAARAKTAAVNVLLVVTANACRRWLIVEGLALVTSEAACAGMRTHQRKTRVGMIEREFLPATIGMAFGTTVSQAALMNIAFTVTDHALVRRLFESFIAVAGRAFDWCMFSGKWKLRFLMVKQHLLPPPIDVAVAAVGTQPAFVYVVLPMAGNALTRCVFERQIPVARCTLRLLMLSRQSKTRLIVIEMHVLPVRFLVAARAIGAEFCVVNIVFAMAGIAFMCSGTVFLAIEMATATCHIDMFAAQNEIGKRVIEGPLVERHDSGRPAFVLGMARMTGLLRGTPVKAGLAGNIACDVLVAIKT
jgi:hypothetical protein